MTTPASRDHAFEVEDQLTSYEIETLVSNAEAYPAGSRLELVLSGHVDDAFVGDVSRRLARLAARGIRVTVRSVPLAGLPTESRQDVKDIEERSLEPAKRLVLVADDDADMRRLVATLLRMAGYRVIEASDGAQILSRIESTAWSGQPEQVDAIVADINMPGLSGLDLLAALHGAHRKTPVVLITAFGTDETRAVAGELGAAAFLDKPFAPEALRTAVAGVCGL